MHSSRPADTASRVLTPRLRPASFSALMPVTVLAMIVGGVFCADCWDRGTRPSLGEPAGTPATPETADKPDPTAEPVKTVSLAAADDDAHDHRADSYAAAVPAFFENYCLDCHEGEFAENNVDLAIFDTLDAARTDRDTFQRVVAQISVGAMPPPDYAEVPAEVRAELAGLIRDTALHVDCDTAENLGQVATKRLTAFEYENTVRDLLGVDIDAASVLPNDDSGSGFDNQAESLTLSSLAIERYLDLAEHVADLAFRPGGTDEEPVNWRIMRVRDRKDLLPRFVVKAGSGGSFEFEVRLGIVLKLRTELGIDEKGRFPADRLDKIRRRLGPRKVTLKLDGRPLTTVVTTEFVTDVREADAGEDGVPRLQAEFESTVRFVADMPPRGHVVTVSSRGNEVVLRGGSALGPLPADTVPIDRLGFDEDDPAPALARCLRRAFRRPVGPDEVARYLSRLEAADSFRDGLREVLLLTLASPDFLFRPETDAPVPGGTGHVGLDAHSLATRLSYFLWASMPDERLDRLADAGLLARGDVLADEADRMLDDPKSAGFVDRFFGQWLGLPTLDELDIDNERYPNWSSRLRLSAAAETRRFVASLVAEDRPISDLLDADYSFINPRLAEIYGLDFRGLDPTDLYYKGPVVNTNDYKPGRRSAEYLFEEEFERVALPPGRRGVLTQISVLLQTSNPTGTSPVKRGKWVLETILGTPPPPAPASAPELEEPDEHGEQLSLRERLDAHRADPACASCHEMMDPIGYGLENFDVLGRWRGEYAEFDGGGPVESHGTLAGGAAFDGPLTMIASLDRDALARRFAERLYTYALGRAPVPADSCGIDAVVNAADNDDRRVRAFVRAVVLGDAFRHIRPTAPSAEL